MDKKWKPVGWLAFGIVILFIVIPLLVNFLFEKKAPIDILKVSWNASDALGYIAGALTFLGTMFLGWISWNQNQQLQKIEKTNFIEQNSCMVLLEKISFKDLGKIAVNLGTEHFEPIVKEDGLNADSGYGSFKVVLGMKRIKSQAVLVKVHSLTMFLGEQNVSAYIFASAYDNCFSKIAISEETDSFEITILVKPESKKRIIGTLNQNCQITMEIIVEILTANYVSTKIKCRGTFAQMDREKTLKSDFSIQGVSTICFWCGNEIVDSEKVKFRNSKG